MLTRATIKLDRATIAELPLAEDRGKDDVFYFDARLSGHALRYRRRHEDLVPTGWYIQTRAGIERKNYREKVADYEKLSPEVAFREARKRLASITLGSDPTREKADAKARAKETLGALAPKFLEWKPTKPRPRGYGPLRPRPLAITELHLMERWKPLHGRPVGSLHHGEIAQRLTEISKEYGPHAAETARTVLSEFYGTWAMKMGFASANPVILTPQFAGPGSRERVLDSNELAAVWRASEDVGDEYCAIVRLLILLAARRDEIADLRWPEINIDRAELEIPGARTKNHRP